MKKLFAAYLLSITMPLCAQTLSGKVEGQVNDDNKKLVEFANVTLHREKDSILVKAAITDQQGNFGFENLNEGHYFVRVSQLGYQKFKSPVFGLNADNKTIKLSAIELITDAKALGEVTVRSSKPFIEREIDKIVLNVENSITSAGNNVIEVLEKAPGVTVDADGNISLKGKQGVLILMDGKPTNLSTADLANMLRGMAASQIEKIELITNPSAKYDATGNAGIINIRMKRDNKLGMNGSANLSVGQGLRFKQNAGLNLNYRDRKWNVFGNLNQVNRGGENRTILKRKFVSGDGSVSTLTQRPVQTPHFSSLNLKLGIDYFLSRKTTIGANINGVMNNILVKASTPSDFRDPSGTITSSNVTNNSNRDRWRNYTLNLNLKHTFDSTGKELTADIDYASYNQRIIQNSTTETTYMPGQALPSPYILRGDLPSDIDIKTFKIDYVNPLGKDSKFEIGVKSSFVSNDGNAQYYLVQDGAEIVDLNRTNHFIYHENINAGYVNFNTKFRKTGVQLGLRGEQTIAEGVQLSTNATFSRKYFQLFPTVFIRQEINKNHELSLNVGRRIQRPNYQDLNPFKFFLDIYVYREGNPQLQPQFTFNSELAYTFKQQYNISFYHSRTRDIISTVLIQNDVTKVAAQSQQNLNNLETIGYNISIPVKYTKWWNGSLYFENYSNRYWGKFLNGEFNQQLTTYFVNTTNTFTIGKTWNAELTGYYQSPFLFGTFKILSQAQIALGVQKQLWQRKGTLKVSISDPFLTQRNNMIVKYQNMDMTLRRRLDSRVVSLAFNYRFGKSTVAPARRRNGGLEEENRRIQTNG